MASADAPLVGALVRIHTVQDEVRMSVCKDWERERGRKREGDDETFFPFFPSISLSLSYTQTHTHTRTVLLLMCVY